MEDVIRLTIGVILVCFGFCHFFLAHFQPKGNCYYDMVVAKASVCFSEETTPKIIAAQGILLFTFAILLITGIIGNKE
jgi:hypothetical protein